MGRDLLVAVGVLLAYALLMFAGLVLLAAAVV